MCIRDSLETGPDCAAEFEHVKSGRQIDELETPQRKNDANVITAVKKKIVKKVVKIVASVCLIFVVLGAIPRDGRNSRLSYG